MKFGMVRYVMLTAPYFCTLFNPHSLAIALRRKTLWFTECSDDSFRTFTKYTWLIQQLFKGVDMRWSEPGFNYLFIYDGCGWVNGVLNTCFQILLSPPNR